MRAYLSSFGLGNQPERLAELAAGDLSAGVVFNARDNAERGEREEKLKREINWLNELGFDGSEIDLRDYNDEPGNLEADLGKYGLLWVPGGNSFLLRRAMKDSGFDEVVKEMLRKDEVAYAGYSAGVVVLAKTLRGIELVDDPAEVKKVYGKEVVWEGLGLLPYSVAPHYKSDHPESEAVEKVVGFFEQEQIPYKALKDGQAILVRGEQEEIVD